VSVLLTLLHYIRHSFLFLFNMPNSSENVQSTSSSSLSSETLVSASSVSRVSLPIKETITITKDTVTTKKLRELMVCMQRMLGRAAGEIVGPITFTQVPKPGKSVVSFIGIVPENIPSNYTPVKADQVLACGGFIHATNNLNKTFVYNDFDAGVSRTLKGTTTSIVAGDSPQLFFYGTTDSSDNDILIEIRYTLALEGYDYISPFNKISYTASSTSQAAGSST
jgi:hypothetical protein